MKVVIPFVQIKSINPNLPNSNHERTLEVYFKCICVAFASLRRWNPHLPLQLTTNEFLPDPYGKLLKEYEVNIVLRDYEYKPPATFGLTFAGSFYLLDAIEIESESAIFLDPDVLCVGKLNLDLFEKYEIMALDIGFPNSSLVNGITPQQAANIFSKFVGAPPHQRHKHFGGEAIYISGKISSELKSDLKKLWKFNLQEKIKGDLHFTTEEHILSSVLSLYNVGQLNDQILRIWTSKSFKETQGGIFDPKTLPLWHLPSEKAKGFLSIWQDLTENTWFYNSDNATFRRISTRSMNISLTFTQKLIYRAAKLIVTLRNLFENSIS